MWGQIESRVGEDTCTNLTPSPFLAIVTFFVSECQVSKLEEAQTFSPVKIVALVHAVLHLHTCCKSVLGVGQIIRYYGARRSGLVRNTNHFKI